MNRPNVNILKGIKVIELAGLAPGPFCGLILADFGADVLLVERKNSKQPFEQRLNWNKKKIIIDLKLEIKKLKTLCLNADVLIDPFRPGTLENIGLDPVQLLKVNKKLIIVRISGYGQIGPFSKKAGHDINFLALSGIMPIACGKNLQPPVNLLGDFAGGSLMAAFGVVLALFQRTKNGNEGQILDCSMTEGVAYLSTFLYMYNDVSVLFGDNFSMRSGLCPIYRTYKTKDNKNMAVGALEPKFHLKLFEVLGFDPKTTSENMYLDPINISNQIQEVFLSKTQDEWTKIFLKIDACVTPVLDINNVINFSHHIKRNAFKKIQGSNFEYDDKFVARPVPIFYNSKNLTCVLDKNLKNKL